MVSAEASGMAQLAGHKRVACISVHRENKPQLSSSIAEEAYSEDDNKPAIKTEPLVISGIRKRKRLGRSQLIEMKAATRMKERQNSSHTSSQSKRDPKKLKGMERWSHDR